VIPDWALVLIIVAMLAVVILCAVAQYD